MENLALLSEWPKAWVAEEQAQHQVNWDLIREPRHTITGEIVRDGSAAYIRPAHATPWLLGTTARIRDHWESWARRILAIVRKTIVVFEQTIHGSNRGKEKQRCKDK
jgi:hypothetical protein